MKFRKIAFPSEDPCKRPLRAMLGRGQGKSGCEGVFHVFCVDFVKSELILRKFGGFFEKMHFHHKTLARGSSVQCLVVFTAGVVENVCFVCFMSIV